MLAPRLASVRVNPHGHRGRVGPRVIGDDAGGSFYDKGLEGASHHAVIPNVNTIDKLREVWPRLTTDEKKLFDVIARAYLAALMPDFRYRQTTATLDVRGFEFRASGRQPIDLGWRAAFPEWQPADEKGDEAQLLPPLRNGETAQLHDPKIEDKETRPPPLQRRHSDRGDAKCLALC
jgi:DNA topoisomerase-3